jgi:hypothetical protein
MMRNFEVTYSLSTDPNATSTSAFQSRTDVSNLKMIVQAISPNQAQTIVEGMFGGRQRCQVTSAYPKNG